jgi:hypothetical protein
MRASFKKARASTVSTDPSNGGLTGLPWGPVTSNKEEVMIEASHMDWKSDADPDTQRQETSRHADGMDLTPEDLADKEERPLVDIELLDDDDRRRGIGIGRFHMSFRCPRCRQGGRLGRHRVTHKWLCEACILREEEEKELRKQP